MGISQSNNGVADRIRELRLSLHFTQEQFAELLDISVQLYKKVESGENNLSMATLRKMKSKLNFSADYLLFGENDDFSSTWSKILSWDPYDKMRLLIKLFATLTVDNHRIDLKSMDGMILLPDEQKMLEVLLEGLYNK